MKKILLFAFAVAAVAQTPSVAPPPLVTLPTLPSGPSNFSLVAAIGAPTTVPRHAAAAFGFSEAVSTTQDFFLTVLLSQPAGSATNEQESIVLGMTQSLGTFTVSNVKFRSWFSAAFGTTLANAEKINVTGTPGSIISTASASASFTSQYVFGLGYDPKWCAKCEYGPIARYTHIVGQPSQAEVGLYWKWSP